LNRNRDATRVLDFVIRRGGKKVKGAWIRKRKRGTARSKEETGEKRGNVRNRWEEPCSGFDVTFSFYRKGDRLRGKGIEGGGEGERAFMKAEKRKKCWGG